MIKNGFTILYYEGLDSIAGRAITKLRSSEDIDALAGKEEEAIHVSQPSGQDTNNIMAERSVQERPTAPEESAQTLQLVAKI